MTLSGKLKNLILKPFISRQLTGRNRLGGSASLLHAGALAVIAVSIAGCAVGPEFHSPAAPPVSAYTAAPFPTETVASATEAGGAQRFVSRLEIPPQWWNLFHSGKLDTLMRQALADSPTLAAAEASLRQAWETRRAQLGALFPSVDANFSGKRQQFTGASFGQPGAPGSLFTLYNASVNVSYSLDLFGGTRRGLEALQSQLDYQRYLLEAAHLTLTSNIVTVAVQEASLRARISATREIIADGEEQLKLVERQFQLGGAARTDLLAQQAELAQTRATLPPLEKELAQTRHQLAVLAGRFPGAAADLPEFQFTDLQLPSDLPVSLPSDLVRQRPDVRASEELLHEACARVGVATANLFPKLTISGDYGSQSTTLSGLFASGSSVWGIGASLLQPIFHGGELLAERRAAMAAYDQAAANYRATVLQAFQNVADVLRALELDARTLQAQTAAEQAASDSLDLTGKQFRIGAVSYLVLLNAQRQHQQALLTLAQARAARFADTAALFQALGGGWWNRQADAGISTASKKE
jgi:NodT family efflux transporter outer membrane factor (OMF) lipoprotein